MNAIDLNCDMGELPDAIEDGTQDLLMRSVTSVNVACGGHAGDAATMKSTVEQALRWQLAIGAHPGYPDRASFGRKALELPLDMVRDSVFEQVRALIDIATQCGATVTHVKPHGALYNQAVYDRELAQAIADGVGRWSHDVVLVGLASSPMLEVFRERGFAVAGEAFADRRYEADGTLRARSFENALIRDPAEAARQAVQIAVHGTVTPHEGEDIALGARTICIHGDTPGAVEIAAAVAAALRGEGVPMRALGAEAR